MIIYANKQETVATPKRHTEVLETSHLGIQIFKYPDTDFKLLKSRFNELQECNLIFLQKQ